MRLSSKVFVIAALLAAVSAVSAQRNTAAATGGDCLATNLDIKNTGTKPAKAVLESAFDQEGVEQHFDSIFIDDFRSNINTTFSCVDSRGEYNIFGTPGGDFAELAAAIVVYLNQTEQKVDQAEINKIFSTFVNKFANNDRPFYYHTSDEKLNKVFHTLWEAGIKPKPTVFPETMPEDQKAKDAWLDALSIGKNQGCGHVRLMIDQYPDYGLETAAVPQALIKAFFSYWWPTPAYSDERSRVKMTVVQGPLDGHAMTIVGSKGCPGKSPAVPPSHGGSQMFLYHADAVEDFRKALITPFFVEYGKQNGKTVDFGKFYNALKSLQAKHLGATLTNLAPANALPLWSVTVESETVATQPRAANTRPRPLNLANPQGRRSPSGTVITSSGARSGSGTTTTTTTTNTNH